MSNIGFMQHCTKSIEELYKFYTNNPKKSPSKTEKEEYVKLMFELEQMKTHNEIEDIELFEKLYKILKNCDLTTLVNFRKKVKKAGVH